MDSAETHGEAHVIDAGCQFAHSNFIRKKQKEDFDLAVVHTVGEEYV